MNATFIIRSLILCTKQWSILNLFSLTTEKLRNFEQSPKSTKAPDILTMLLLLWRSIEYMLRNLYPLLDVIYKSTFINISNMLCYIFSISKGLCEHPKSLYIFQTITLESFGSEWYFINLDWIYSEYIFKSV